MTTENGSLKGANRENTRSFNLYRDQSYPLNLLNADKFSGVELQGVASKFKNGKGKHSLQSSYAFHDKTIGTFFVPFYKRLTTDFLAGKFELQACDTSVVRIKHQQTGLYVAMHKGGKVYTTLVSSHFCYMTVNSARPVYHFQFAECLAFTIELSQLF